MTNRKITFAVISITLIMILTACTSSSKNNEDIPTLVKPPKETIKTVRVQVGSIEKKYSIKGNVVPVEKMDMGFQSVGGSLAKVNVKVGDEVKVGDVLAELSNDDIRYKIILEEQKVKLAQLDYDEAVEKKLSNYDMQKAEINLNIEKLSLKKAKEDLQKCILTSKMAGKVISIHDLKLGDEVEAYNPVVTVANLSQMQVVSGDKNPNFVLGRKVVIQGPKNLMVDGEVIANTVLENKDGSTGTILVKFSDSNSKLGIGDAVNVVCVAQKKDSVVMVPIGCVKYDVNEKPYCEIYKNDDVIQKYIEIGIDDGYNMEVVNGILEGDLVVTN